MSTEQNKAIARRIYEDVISQGKFELIGQLFHPAFYDHSNPPGWPQGPEGARQIIGYFRTAFDGWTVTVEDAIAEDDRVAIRLTSRGTHAGEFFGIPPTGRPVVMPGVQVLRFQDGRVVEHWAFHDDMGVMRQLGALPAQPA